MYQNSCLSYVKVQTLASWLTLGKQKGKSSCSSDTQNAHSSSVPLKQIIHFTDWNSDLGIGNQAAMLYLWGRAKKIVETSALKALNSWANFPRFVRRESSAAIVIDYPSLLVTFTGLAEVPAQLTLSWITAVWSTLTQCTEIGQLVATPFSTWRTLSGALSTTCECSLWHALPLPAEPSHQPVSLLVEILF